MESEKVIVWKDDPATQVEVATFVNQSTAAFVVDVTEPQQVKEWTKLLESTTADDHAQGDAAPRPRPRRVPNASIYRGVVVTTVSTFALLIGFAIWRRYEVDAELSPSRILFRLRPPPQQA
ncbi:MULTISPECIES: hypothetical protein [Burkholderia]|uniref:hypothetical protein n=1 Tax=Burkholderia TaxID=32008 RepID=UPI000863A9AA|nr:MULTISPECIES: hypothetical protein [Burkholderia]AOL06618.1 hypothetical protein WI95_21890 [Burkholderia contaminans]MBY4728022.1 hypothetical protein [Burkholderia contaminans]MCI3969209.1 hypothetical protein [Burkholderia sp. HI4860]MDN7787220.1 hypothetical protein [Burkholderia contaminans]OXI98440.1 hypothetical protein CFB48_23875 [Burkholderia sp. AU33647]